MTTPTRPSADAIVTAALAWEGTPYRHLGRTRRAIDCAGLIILVGREVGAFAPDFDVRNYPRDPSGRLRMVMLSSGMLPVRTLGHSEDCRRDELLPGEVLVMRGNGSAILDSHLAIWTGRHVVHASAPFKRCVRHGLLKPWSTYVSAVYRYPGVTYG
ncbi:hypothetical protein [Spectribacter hydrogenoxidans]|uniref:NlpC/P60 domain-containing protein n=1 Tax=Spectribacter hydrogenoxidans TaxID=3075608 RepID=A0ABU3C158_9GAMM|nr:hypothetical protein [Salinisphaera sp. W335]MDT0635106.1 hypothetical protein [Salinisphaera sp. W335]